MFILKNGPVNYGKFIVGFIGLFLGVVGFSFTQLWFILGMGLALFIASIVAG